MNPLRDVFFTEYLEFDFQGSVAKNALCLGDVDNDGLSELVVGNEKGDVAVFKGDSAKPVYLIKTSGIITAIALGDILNLGRNVLVVITACGQCSLYDINLENEDMSKKVMAPFHIQLIPANIKIAHVADINGDGFCELVFGLTDRVVRTFRWVCASKNLKERVIGKLVGLNKWEFAEQIECITVRKSNDGKPSILVGQANGTFIALHVDTADLNQSIEPLDESVGDILANVSLNIETLTSVKSRNCDMCSISLKNTHDNSYEQLLVVASLDGVLTLVKNKETIWRRTLDSELFVVRNMDVTQDGNEEVVACSWDGNTYIVTENNNGVHFSFRESVNTFTAGLFGLGKKQTPSLVYVTFNNKIYLYYDVYIKHITPKTLTEVMKSKAEYRKLVETLGYNINDSNKLKALHKNILYYNKHTY